MRHRTSCSFAAPAHLSSRLKAGFRSPELERFIEGLGFPTTLSLLKEAVIMKGMVLVLSNDQPGTLLRRFRSLSISLFLTFFFLYFVSPTALAQTITSNIEGTIRDANGSVVSGAQVTAKSSSLGVERTATCDANGFYRLTALPAGI